MAAGYHPEFDQTEIAPFDPPILITAL